ncbi:MAG: type I pullulanase, partial [Lachnospiraceae bacterium]
IMPIIYSTEEFEKKYTYNGDDLGLTVGDTLTFKVWAPMAEKVVLNLYETGSSWNKDLIESREMNAGEKGIFELTAEKELLGKYYTYTVTRDGEETEVVDPYARSTGVNGLRGMILDLSTTDPEGWDADKNPHADAPINDAVIYEVHVRDLSSDESSGIKNAGKFLGFTETGTKSPEGKATGIDHIKELGATHVHILPMYDYGSIDESISYAYAYNWGYDPQNYNVPEGSYATDPANGEVRVKELKAMVQAMHENGLSVVMDVVYNHVYNASEFCINKILPGYFSRISDTGTYSNGSGCGNDTASERSMVRKYIVDSVVYWATEYHLDGFRFDLVGLLDVDTINQIVEEVHKVRPDVIFYGEGWSMNTQVTKDVKLATQQSSGKTPGFAYFNDNLRDGVKGHVFDELATGYVSGKKDAALGVKNSWMAQEIWSENPTQIVQYVSCHDNLTLFDKLAVSRADASEEDRIRMNNLSAAIYFTAQGVPFMMSGEEMLRSKVKADGTFDSNSYASSDEVNSLKWSALADPKVEKTFEYYKGLIAFRKAHPALRLTSAEDVSANVAVIEGLDDQVLAFQVSPANGESSKGIFVVFNPNPEKTTVTLPEGNWNVYVDADKAGTTALYGIEGGKAEV